MSASEQKLARLRTDALGIFEGALSACAIEKAFARHIQFEGQQMRRVRSPLLAPVEQSLQGIKRVLVIAFGKAALPMLEALVSRLPEKLRVEGVCSAPSIPEKRRRHIRYYAGSHPLPDEDSLKAAEAALQLLRKADAHTQVFFLVSGGGSAMLELPQDPGISLDDLRAFYETLVHSGADITEINTVRKYFSSVKGGRLAQAAPRSPKLTLLLADVPMKDLGLVASSPTLPDQSTWADCAAVLARWDLLPRFPASVRAFYERLSARPAMAGPAEIPLNEVEVLLSNHDFVNAARDHARGLGYKVVIDNRCDDWQYDRAADFLLERFAAIRSEAPRVCLLSSGEVTVPMGDTRPGCGGRNQQFALYSALKIESEPEMAVLSAGSDGIDGNSPAAGAIADTTTASRARDFAFHPEQNLARFNSCPLFTSLGDAIVTGPTGNNLRDLRVLLSSNES